MDWTSVENAITDITMDDEPPFALEEITSAREDIDTRKAAGYRRHSYNNER